MTDPIKERVTRKEWRARANHAVDALRRTMAEQTASEKRYEALRTEVLAYLSAGPPLSRMVDRDGSVGTVCVYCLHSPLGLHIDCPWERLATAAGHPDHVVIKVPTVPGNNDEVLDDMRKAWGSANPEMTELISRLRHDMGLSSR